MKWAALACLLAGLTLATGLVVHFGASDVGAAVAAAGWTALAAITAVHLAMIAVMGSGWWVLLRGRQAGLAPWTFVWGRLLREAGSEVLPLSQVGGYVLGARAVILRGITGTDAAASTVIDVTLELFAQIAFTALGLGLLLWFHPGTGLAVPVTIGLGIAVLLAVAVVVVQRRHAGILDRIASHLAQGWLAAIAARSEAVQIAIHEIYRRRGAIWICLGLHLATWIVSTVEPWLALRFMGAPLGFGQLLAIESLVYAGRSVAFFVPNAFGVQEGAYIVLGAMFGLSPDIGLALSLLKRGRDLVLGVPTILVWQAAEGRRWWTRRPAARLARNTRDAEGTP